MPQLERLKLKSPSQKRGRTSTHELAIDQPVSMKRGGSTYYYHKDGLGSITEGTNSSETVVRSYKYNAFGEIESETGTLDNPFTYTGRERDEESGLYYYRARYYDPEFGRFLTRDPLYTSPFVINHILYAYRHQQAINLYPYVVNNPLRFIDPLGLYVDENVFIPVWPYPGRLGIGIVVGFQSNSFVDPQTIHVLLGLGIGTGGPSVTGNDLDVMEGFGVGFQGGAYLGFQRGWAFGHGSFWEWGLVSPGVAGTGYWVSPDISPWVDEWVFGGLDDDCH